MAVDLTEMFEYCSGLPVSRADGEIQQDCVNVTLHLGESGSEKVTVRIKIDRISNCLDKLRKEQVRSKGGDA